MVSDVAPVKALVMAPVKAPVIVQVFVTAVALVKLLFCSSVDPILFELWP